MPQCRGCGTPKEVAIERKVCLYAQAHEWWAIKMKAENKRFWPDRMFIGPEGQVFFIEFKRPKVGKLHPGQERMIKGLRKRGFKVYVVDSVDYGRRIMDSFANGEPLPYLSKFGDFIPD